MAIGIDHIASYVPKLYVDLLGPWAQERATTFAGGDVTQLKGKVQKGIGITKMAICDEHEDAATMAANAVLELLKNCPQITLDDVAALVVATETGVDHSKSMGAYVLGMLENYFGKRFSHVSCPEYKFACVSSTYAIESVVTLLEGPRKSRPYGIVVATDIAQYDWATAGEMTQGAGSVAMLIGPNPRLLEIEDGPFGTYCCDERDFYRPLDRKTPVVDGHHSIQVYCNAVYSAFEDYLRARHERWNDAVSSSEQLLFHLPFPKMAQYALATILSPLCLGRALHEMGDPQERKALERQFVQSLEFQEIFRERTESSLFLSQQIGNIYTGSLFLGLQSVLELALAHGRELTGQRVVLFGYGSGASSKVFAGRFTSRWRESARALTLSQYLLDQRQGGQRRELTLAEYYKLHEVREIGPHGILPPQREFALMSEGTGRERSDYGLRYYRYID